MIHLCIDKASDLQSISIFLIDTTSVKQTPLSPRVLQVFQIKALGELPGDLCSNALSMCLRSMKYVCQDLALCLESTHLRAYGKMKLIYENIHLKNKAKRACVNILLMFLGLGSCVCDCTCTPPCKCKFIHNCIQRELHTRFCRSARRFLTQLNVSHGCNWMHLLPKPTCQTKHRIGLGGRGDI